MKQEFLEIKEQVYSAIVELIDIAQLPEDSLLVLGCSTSEVMGGVIGKSSNLDVAEVIIDTILTECRRHKLNLCVQGCEHINRSLVIERSVAQKHHFDIVSVVPALHAGGACSVVAYKSMIDPVMVEHVIAKVGIDIGDTSIGMHIKHVQIPTRLKVKQVGFAHVTALTSRPKLIGGPRAEYILK